jgi:hypothetical protein
MKMDIKNTVIDLLTQYSDFKDNDQQLVAWFWKLEMEAHGYPASTPHTNILQTYGIWETNIRRHHHTGSEIDSRRNTRTAWEEVQRTPGQTKHC